MIERSCVRPFIERAQSAFQNGSGLKEVLGLIEPYQRKVESRVRDVSAGARIPHAIGLSAAGLGTLAVYEYVRAHGAPLPDSNQVVSMILPVASFSQGNIVTHDLHTATGFYSKDDLPKEVGGEPVEWDFVEPKPGSGGHDATFTGHTKKKSHARKK